MTCQQHAPVISGAPVTRMQQLRYIANNYDPKYTTVISVAELRVFMSLLEGIETMNSVKLCDAMTEVRELLGEMK
jgi:hypothetical protein